MPVDVQLAATIPTPPARAIEAWAEAALGGAAAAGDGDADPESDCTLPERTRLCMARTDALCVRVVDQAESQALNHAYRGKAAPTNVLSFPADVPVPELAVLGDVVVCAPVVRREAQDQGKPYHDHFAHMVVHGVLHLLGYDHQSATDAAVMERLEIQILDRFGIGDPYGEG